MARRLEAYLAALPAEEQALVEAHATALVGEVAARSALRRVLQRAAPQSAVRLKTTSAGIGKMERRVDAYVGALRAAVAAAGGTLEVVVRLPDGLALPIAQFEGLLGESAEEQD